MAGGASHPRRIRLGQLPAGPERRALQRLQRAGFVEVNEGVELVGEPGLKIVAPALGLGTVDDADGALEALCAEQAGRVVLGAQIKPELREAGGVEEFLVTAAQAGADLLALGGLAPVA